MRYFIEHLMAEIEAICDGRDFCQVPPAGWSEWFRLCSHGRVVSAMILTDTTYADFTTRMAAAKDAHRRRGTTGGKGNQRQITATERRERDAGLSCHDIALATVDAIWSEFRSWSQSGRVDPVMGRYEPETDFPF